MQAESLASEPPVKPKNTGVSSLSFLQGILPTQELKPGSPALQADPYHLSYQGSPIATISKTMFNNMVMMGMPIVT